MPPSSRSVTPGGGVPGERFEILGKLGAGGLGVVYRAFDRQRGAEVALKTLREVTGADLYRFKREFRALADLVHPNLARLHELHTLGGDWLLTMELVEGVSFIDWVRPEGAGGDGASARADATATSAMRVVHKPRPERAGVTAATAATPGPGSKSPPGSTRQRVIAAALRVERLESALYQLVDTVHALHHAGKLHRDLKPSNVLVEASGRVVVLDFGLVADLAAAPDLTHTSAAVGTPAYMSPEQSADAPLTPASDWYSIGVMLYEALTGRRPIDVLGARAEELDHLPPPRALVADPPPHLEALCLRLLARDPAARPGGEEILAALGRESSPASRALVRSLTAPPFVGREAELATLRTALADAHAGRGVAVFVRGASGMGKTSLLRQFLDGKAATHGTVVLRGRCYERESVPFKTLDAIVDALTTYLLARTPAELAELVPADAAALAKLFPVMLRVPAIAAPESRSFLPADPVELRRRAFGALRELLARMAERHPVVLSIDDVQWGDADSGHFLAELLHHPDAPSMLLIVSHRSEDEDVTPHLAALRRSREALGGAPVAVPMREITLGPLAEAESRALLGQVGAGDDGWAAQVVRESGGSPMFLTELARVHADPARAASAPEQGLRLEDVLAARIGELPEDARTVLTFAAVAARPLRSDTALRAAGLAGEGSVMTLLAGERLVRVRQGPRGAELETYHDRIRSAAVARLDPEERRRTHARLAEALEANADHDHEALVEHWLEAGRAERSVVHAIAAATLAEERLAFHRAAELHALALAHGQFDAAERRRLEVRLGHALVHSGRLEAAAEAFARAAEGAPAEERLELTRLELEQLLRGGQLAIGLEKARVVLASIGQRLPRSTFGTIASLLAHRVGIRFRRLERDIPPATTPPSARELHRIEVLWSVSSGLGFVSPVLGQMLQMRYLRAAVASRMPRHLGLALSIELVYLGIGGTRHRERSELLRTRALALAERIGDLEVRGVARVSGGLSSFLSGHWREAAERLEAGALDLRNATTTVRWVSDLREHFHISALWYLGETRRLVHMMPIFLRAAEERGDAFALRSLRGWRGNFYWLVVDQPDEARAQVASVSVPRAAGVPAQLTHYYELLALANADLYVGTDAAAAHRRVEAIWSDLDRAMLLRVQNCFIEAWALRARAALAQAAASTDAAERRRLVRVALLAAKRIDAQRTAWGAPLAVLVRATCAHLEGDRARAVASLREAHAGFLAADMSLYAAVTQARLAEVEGDAARLSASLASMAAESIARPDAIVRMLAPAWSDPANVTSNRAPTSRTS